MSTQPANTSAGAHRAKLVHNPHFVRNGKMAYGHALRKFGFKPTLDYPFLVVDEIVHSGHVAHRVHEHIHGRTPHVAQRRLMMTDEHGQTGEVNAQDVQQVWSTELPKSTLFAGKAIHHNIYDHTKSHTFKPSDGQSWNITYGDGSSASGNVGTDVINIGGVQVKNQAIEMANKLSPSFAQGAGDGLCGLAFGRINTVQPTPAKTPVENMILQSAIQSSAELFTAYLGSYKDKNDPDKGQSFYTFGVIDNDVVKSSGSDIWYTPVDDSNGFWQFSSTSCSINDQVTQLPGGSAIADTGTTLALIDDPTLQKIYAAIPGSKFSKAMGGYVFPSNTAQSALPIVKFDIGGKKFAVNKEDLAFHDFGNGFCYGGIQSRGKLPFNIYGDTWLKSVYAIFDVGRKRFGCVQRIEAPNASSDTKLSNNPPKVDAAQKIEKHDPAPVAQPAAVPIAVPVAPPSAPHAAAPAPVPAPVAPSAPSAPIKQAPSAQPPASGAPGAPSTKS